MWAVSWILGCLDHSLCLSLATEIYRLRLTGYALSERSQIPVVDNILRIPSLNPLDLPGLRGQSI